MDPWDHIRRAARDRRSGSVEVALRAARGLRDLESQRELARAARRLLRAHPAMAPLWRLLAAGYEAVAARTDVARAIDEAADDLEASTARAADGIRWAVTGRRIAVVTHSSSGSVIRALERVHARVTTVACTTSLPGGEGRPLARRLGRLGFDAAVVPDAAVARACRDADIALVGADAITERAVINKVGTLPLALAAREAGIGCYAIASTMKLLPHTIWDGGTQPDAYEETPLALFDAVLTERGPRRSAAVRRAVGGIRIPDALARIKR